MSVYTRYASAAPATVDEETMSQDATADTVGRRLITEATPTREPGDRPEMPYVISAAAGSRGGQSRILIPSFFPRTPIFARACALHAEEQEREKTENCRCCLPGKRDDLGR